MVPPIFRKTAQTRDTFCSKWLKILLSFLTTTAFLSWKLPVSSTHTTVSPTATSQMFLYTWCQCTQRAFWHYMTAYFGHFACVNFFAKQNLRWVQSFSGGNHPWKLNLLKSWPTKYFSHKNFCVYDKHWLLTQLPTFDTHKISILTDKVCVVPYIDLNYNA